MEKNELINKFIRTTSDKMEEAQFLDPLFVHIKDDGENNLYAGDVRVTDNFNIGNMNGEIETSITGKTLNDLKDKSMSEVIIEMICPLVLPSKKSDPSVSISYSGNTLIEVGSTLPVESSFNVSTNKGKWSDDTDYWGDGTSTIVMNPNKWGEVAEEGKYTVTATTTFGEGGVPKDSHGNSCEDLKQNGGTKTASETITAVTPIYINTQSITEMTKQPLVDYNSLQTLEEVTIPAEVDGTLDKFQIWLPYTFSTLTVKQFNPGSGKYDIDVPMVLMDGETSKYIRTKDVTNTNTGAVKYEIKIKK